MSDFRKSLVEVVPIGSFINTFFGNIFVIRQLIIVFSIVYLVLSYASGWDLKEEVSSAVNNVMFFFKFVFLGLLLWIIQESLNSQNRKKSYLFFFNTDESA